MALNSQIAALISCTTDKVCYTQSKGRKRTTKGIFGVMLIKNGEVPEIGDTVNVFDAANPATPLSITITEQNYADTLQLWRMYEQFTCNSNIYWFPQDQNGLRKGLQPKGKEVKDPNATFSNAAQPIAFDYVTTYTLASYMDNVKWFNDFQNGLTKLSVVNFLENRVQVINHKGQTVSINTISTHGVDLNDMNNMDAIGDFVVESHVAVVPQFYTTQNDSWFIDTTTKYTTFTFDNTKAVLNGLTLDSCKGDCIRVRATKGTAFDITLPPIEAAVSSCLTYELYDNCGNALPDTLKIMIDTYSGKISGDATVPAGIYNLTYGVKNECCVASVNCITLIVE